MPCYFFLYYKIFFVRKPFTFFNTCTYDISCKHGIEPNTGFNTYFKTALNVFSMYFFSWILFFFIWFNTFEVIIGIKPVPGDHESNFKKVGSIPCGFNTKGTDISIWLEMRNILGFSSSNCLESLFVNELHHLCNLCSGGYRIFKKWGVKILIFCSGAHIASYLKKFIPELHLLKVPIWTEFSEQN